MTIPEHGTPGPDASQADIDATRHGLDTSELIADTANSVRENGSEASAQVLDVATDDEGAVRPIVPLTALALSVVVVVVVIWHRRR